MREITTMKMPALAVVGPDYRIVRSTETFRKRYEGAEKMCESLPELEQVLTGRADVATVNLGELSVAIQAVTDASGRRQAMLALPPLDPAPAPEPPLAALRDAADDSPALVWVKDLEGRYLYANPRYTEELGTSQERLHGQTDGDLPETETVDGPRLHSADDGLQEPLQLEYTVPAIDGRPALAAFRFVLRDDRGQPIATCGVAAPTNAARLAREEALRLMQLERWNRLDPVDVRAELLEQWHVQAPPPRPEDPEPVSRPTEVPAAPTPAPPPTPAVAPAPVTPELLQAQARIRQSESEAQQALAAAARAAEEADRWRSELEQVRLELERAQAEAKAARSEAERARAELGAAGGELEGMLARLRSRLTDFESSLDGPGGAPVRTP